MTPAFTSWTAFFAMGGYAFYIWLATAAALLSLLGLVVHTCWYHRHLLQEIQREAGRAERMGRRKAAADVSDGSADRRSKAQ
ncbi:heme exporter protein CcmD [Biostraticola tofi]|uniref:Heme exporter protein D n=1 Tax=Biostraticola tofi TaxID=466109 RepID=A0A4R3Z3I5_9GAMM|nr:heme exporter protein CcmD [Biostraticola tofi]TCW00372.1 heme exporter protein D [Biostraticola tofi]